MNEMVDSKPEIVVNEVDDSKSKNAVELKTLNPSYELKISLAGIGLGIASLLIVALIVASVESAKSSWSSWYGCVALPMLLIGLGLFFGGGRNLFSIIQLKTTTYKNPPTKRISCTSCNRAVEVNVRQYTFSCATCNQLIQWSPYGKGFDVDPEITQYQTLLKSGTPCPKCKSTDDNILERPAWFTCPHCKSKVELERIPVG